MGQTEELVANYSSLLLLDPVWSLFVPFHVISWYCSFFFCLTGYRSVLLKNGYSENLELASLLVHINVNQAGVSRLTRDIDVALHVSEVCLQCGEALYSVALSDMTCPVRLQKRSCTHPSASWERSSRSTAVNPCCTTRTPTSIAP